MGMLTVPVELYFAEKKFNLNVPKRKYVDLFIRKKKICNYYLFDKKKKNLIILPSYIFECLYNILFFLKEKSHICGSSNADRDIYDVLSKTSSNFFLNKNEMNEGNAFLEKLGIKKKSRYVCLYVRDPAYYVYKPASDYRNSNINNFVLAVNYLLSKNYYVFRMGYKVQKELQIKSPNFFDYATNGMRTEFLDVFLGHNCYFCITTGSGFDGIPVAARRPTVLTSLAPLNYFRSYDSNNIFIFKHHVNIETNKKMSIKEIFDVGVSQSLNTEEFLLKGVKLEENSSKEILDVVKEMDLRLNKKWKNSKKKNYLKNLFFSRIDKEAINMEGKKLHNVIRCNIGSSFLKNNSYLFK
jgi:putative glycosyltransferase (TIGR04372 family)